MSTPSTVAALALLRNMIGETSLTDIQLEDILVLDMDVDGVFNLDLAAARVWRQKAGDAADLTDTTESGSTRALSKLHKNALDMALMYEGKAAGEEAVIDGSRRTQTRAIRRA